MRKSRLSEAGENLFQRIKRKTAEAEKAGRKIIKLSIGQPSGPAFLEARTAAATAVLSEDEFMHEYQDNGSPGVPDFARRFVQTHVKIDLSQRKELSFLPIPGIKPMIPLIPFACGAKESFGLQVATTTDPGYPTPKDWCAGYLGQLLYHHSLKLGPANNFRFFPDDLFQISKDIGSGDFKAKLVMMNYPHNPSGQVAIMEWLLLLCHFCERHDIRIWNDAAYAGLASSASHCTLTDVACEFPELSWAEAFSGSKLGNCTGWRVGAMVGSSDFIADVARIKGNTDSGFAAPMAAGLLRLVENHFDLIESLSSEYNSRLDCFINILTNCRMRLACKPGAGFFSLWHAPRMAFGEAVKNAEHFNSLMIERVGIVGVDFNPYIRYSVAQNDIVSVADEIRVAFETAAVAY
ncbi:MAG: aminotransferase class I/II-fold pyridoxal phosphate-dependent enzyme [Candidatus Taylorbacteria bacterium]|nr:aminotransferase class I/II-fold pyridoxal phosphate-dependent enzyme [Candidatus Taylorbacteria bacterium]